MNNVLVYAPTAKALKKGALKDTDRFIFTGPTQAICYHADTREIIEPFMLKSIDSHVEQSSISNVTLKLPEAVKRMYPAELLVSIEPYLT